MKVIGVIPARFGSTRLPGKILVNLLGRPLIHWVVERVLKARKLDDLLVATDDQRIADALKGLPVRAVMTRADHPSGTDRIAEAVQGSDAGVVINIQGDEPLIDPDLVDRLAETMLADRALDMATAAAPVTSGHDLQASSIVKVVWNEKHEAMYFSRSVIPHVRDGDGMPVKGLHWRHIGIYAYRKTFLERLVRTPQSACEKAEKLEQLRALSIGARMAVLETVDTGVGVDTPEDVARVEALLAQRK